MPLASSSCRVGEIPGLAVSVHAAEGPVIVLAHNLGSIATTHLPESAASRIVGALLVAPADPE